MTATMKTLRFGIEIETVGRRCETLARAIHTVVGGVVTPAGSTWFVTEPSGRCWKAEPDGSLTGARDGGFCGEIVSPILSHEDLGTVQAIVRAVQSAGATADHSTGIHIHVDGASFDVRSLVNLVRFVHRQERLLEHVFAAHTNRLRFCKPIDEQFLSRLERTPPKTMQDLKTAWYGKAAAVPGRRHDSRYHGLNLNSFFFRRTIEFRYFNGTLNADAVKANVELVLALATHAINAKAATSKRRAFDPATAKYDFRVVLLRLGLIGKEFRTTRAQLTGRLAGSAAWKHGRRDRPARPPTTTTNLDTEADQERPAA